MAAPGALTKASEEIARSAAAGDFPRLERWLKRRDALAGAGAADSWTPDDLRRSLDLGRETRLALEARRHWIGERLAEARRAKRSRERLRPRRDRVGATLDVVS